MNDLINIVLFLLHFIAIMVAAYWVERLNGFRWALIREAEKLKKQMQRGPTL